MTATLNCESINLKEMTAEQSKEDRMIEMFIIYGSNEFDKSVQWQGMQLCYV
jgi:hypothetical protein